MISRKTLRLIVIIFLVVYGLYVGITLYRMFSVNTPVVIPSRQITQNSLHLQEIWRKKDIDLPSAGFIATDPVIAIANYDRNSLQYLLQGLDTTTGEVIWEVLLPARVTVGSLITSHDRLYVAITWEIQVYHLYNGQLLWQTAGEPRDRSGYRLAWFDENLVNYSSVVGEDYRLMSVYNPNNGALIQQNRIPINPMPLLITARIEYKGERGKLFAFDRYSGRQIWQTNLSGDPQLSSALVGPYLLVATYRRAGSIAGLHLVNADNGMLKWYALEDDLLSNFAVIDRTVYAIRRNGDIVGLDLDTGQEVGIIKFDSDQPDPNQNVYLLSASEGKLFVYYGDSQELIAFQP